MEGGGAEKYSPGQRNLSKVRNGLMWKFSGFSHKLVAMKRKSQETTVKKEGRKDKKIMGVGRKIVLHQSLKDVLVNLKLVFKILPFFSRVLNIDSQGILYLSFVLVFCWLVTDFRKLIHFVAVIKKINYQLFWEKYLLVQICKVKKMSL